MIQFCQNNNKRKKHIENSWLIDKEWIDNYRKSILNQRKRNTKPIRCLNNEDVVDNYEQFIVSFIMLLLAKGSSN